MVVFLKSRNIARNIAKKRVEQGKPAAVVDRGPDTPENKNRWGVSLKGEKK